MKEMNKRQINLPLMTDMGRGMDKWETIRNSTATIYTTRNKFPSSNSIFLIFLISLGLFFYSFLTDLWLTQLVEKSFIFRNQKETFR